MAPTTAPSVPVDIVGVPISYDVMVELASWRRGEVVVYVNTDTGRTGGHRPCMKPSSTGTSPRSSRPRYDDGNVTFFGD